MTQSLSDPVALGNGQTDISVCVDCASLIANGEVCDGTSDITESHALKVSTIWGATHLALAGSEIEPSFSWSQCEGCGSWLGGDRFDAVAFA